MTGPCVCTTVRKAMLQSSGRYHCIAICRSRAWGSLAAAANPVRNFQWLQGTLVSSSELPSDFDWRAYLKWNPELEMQGVHTREAAEEHYATQGHFKSLVYRDFDLSIRYTACGGLMNQHYCHLATIALAHMAQASKVIWPSMQVCYTAECTYASFSEPH